MAISPLNSADIYTDFNGLAELRREAHNDPSEVLRTVAKQFESLFMQMMLKSMRDASFDDPLFGSNESDMYRDMYDQQIAINLSKQGSLGLADLMVQQLGGRYANNETTGTLTPVPSTDLRGAVRANAPSNAPTRASSSDSVRDDAFASPQEFVETLWPMAEQAADDLGTSAEVLIAQAALETGWGKHVLQHTGGRSSHNLFNIKADARWDADRVNVNTLEYEGDVAVRRRAEFRSYDSFADSFSDYVGFLKSNPRYRDALNNADNPHAFVESLQDAGYATDPAYAEKIQRILADDVLATIKQSGDGTLS